MKKNAHKKNEDLDNTFSITMELQKPIFEDKPQDKLIKPKLKSNLKRNIIIGIVGIFLILSVAVFAWMSDAYEPLELATNSLVSDNQIEVQVGDFISFTPKNITPTKGLILYPGAKVQAEAYAPLAREIAKNGYEVVIVHMPFNFAMLSSNKAQKVIQEYPNIESWAIGGHSLGGVAASKFAAKSTQIDGLVLLASYPMGDELKTLGKKVISIWGSKDGVLNFENLVESKLNLPSDTTYVEIEGGNHGQFGDYGKQKGDHDAIISQQKQLDITSDNIVKFLQDLNS